MNSQRRCEKIGIVRCGMVISGVVLVWMMTVLNAHSHWIGGGEDVKIKESTSFLGDRPIAAGQVNREAEEKVDTKFMAQRSVSLKKKVLTTRMAKAV